MTRITQYFIVSCVLFIFTSSLFAENKHKNEKAVQDAYYAWCTAIGKAKGDPKLIVKFYAPDAILLPTLSHEILINHEGGLNAYFKKLTRLPDIKCIPEKLITRMYTDTAVNTGLYKFSYKEEDGKIITIPARFTFVYQQYGNQWLINKHHSSKMPIE